MSEIDLALRALEDVGGLESAEIIRCAEGDMEVTIAVFSSLATVQAFQPRSQAEHRSKREGLAALLHVATALKLPMLEGLS